MSAFDAEALDASAVLDEVFGDCWTLQPMVENVDANAPPQLDIARLGGPFQATFFDPEAKPIIPNSYDQRQPRRPGIESASPYIEISPAALAAWLACNGEPLAIRRGDALTREADCAEFRAQAPYVSAEGFIRIPLNRLSRNR